MNSTQIVTQTARAAVRFPILSCKTKIDASSKLALKALSTQAQRPKLQASPFLFAHIRSSAFSTTIQKYGVNLSPTHSDPPPPASAAREDESEHSEHPAEISDSEYHAIADQYMNTLVLSLEEKVDSGQVEGMEVEFSAGVLTITHPSKGTYVINKQPPNKQIWLSSPTSGPKRFDWVLASSINAHGGMDAKQDQEGSTGEQGDDGHLGGGKWIYLRDGSSLTGLIREEIGVEVSKESEGEADATPGKEGMGGSGVGGGS